MVVNPYSTLHDLGPKSCTNAGIQVSDVLQKPPESGNFLRNSCVLAECEPVRDSPAGLPPSPFGRTYLTASLFLLSGQKSSRRVDGENRCLMKFVREEAGYRLPGKANPQRMFKHESMELLASILMSTPSPQSVLIFFTWEVSRSTALAHKCAFSLGYFHRLWRL